ncbi:MAG: mycoredoxin [Roseiflexaceae bacterium]
MTTQSRIVMYGTSWCGDCRRARRVFDQHQTAYDYIDIEKDASAADYVQQVNGGNQSVPTIIFPDGSVLVEPSSAVLTSKLQQLGLIA